MSLDFDSEFSPAAESALYTWQPSGFQVAGSDARVGPLDGYDWLNEVAKALHGKSDAGQPAPRSH
jgi:hypothetical protein